MNFACLFQIAIASRAPSVVQQNLNQNVILYITAIKNNIMQVVLKTKHIVFKYLIINF